jgi:DNA-binding response OmpR family regulator
MSHILVVEDDRELADGLRMNLELEGYRVSTAGTGDAALAGVRDGRPDLVILDIMLPGRDGLSVLRQLRQTGDNTPVIVLTARGQEADKLVGFRLGADDYVTKPFGILEILARVAAVLRRAAGIGGNGAAASWRLGALEVRPAARVVLKDGAPVPLSPLAFELLLALLRRQGQVISRTDLLRAVWGYLPGIQTRTVDSHVAELRRQLEPDPTQPRHIITVWKRGYRLDL